MLGAKLLEHSDGIIERWYSAWKNSRHPHPEISEAALKDSLPLQLKIIGRELQKGDKAENPEDMWKVASRLDPETRVPQNIPIEEVIQEYRIFVQVTRKWIRDNKIDCSFDEYSYFYQSVFELAAEAVKRYSAFKAQAVTKERSEYLAEIAHQMRGPVTVISNQLEVLKEKIPPDAADRLVRNVGRLDFLVNGVLRLERYKSEDMPVHAKTFYLGDLLESILRDHEFLARDKGIELETQINRTLKIHTDPQLLTDILGNLIDNAVKYTREGLVKVVAKGKNGKIYIEVRDSGPGIAQKRQKELFKITTSESAGAGIGLSIVKKAVTTLEGTIEVDSEPGEGSKFRVILPKKIKEKNIPYSLESARRA